MKRITKLLFVVTLFITVLSGCGNKQIDVKTVTTNETFNEYLNLLENFTPRPKSDLNEDNIEFDSFLNEQFLNTLEDDFVNYHFKLEDPSVYSLKKPEVNLGEVEYENTDVIEELVGYLNDLKEFDYNSLSKRQQIDFEAFEYSIYESIVDLEISKYESLFAGNVDVIGNLITVLTEFQIRSDEDVLDYLTLLDDVDRYLEDIIEYTDKQKENGFMASAYSIDETIEYLDSLVSKTEDNVFIVEFENNLLKYGNYPDVDTVKEKNRELVINEVIPSLVKVRTYLEDLKSEIDTEPLPLCKINRDIARAKYIIRTSDNNKIDEIYSKTESYFFNMKDKWYQGFSDLDSYKEYLNAQEGNFVPFGMNDVETLEYLKSHVFDYFIDLGEIDYTISPLEESSVSKNILAYYIESPIDNTNSNVIRVNKTNLEGDYIQTYTTLAHEGFPGHLFQNVYAKSFDNSAFRSELSFIGYTEGYGVYAQNLALDFVNFEEEYAKDIIEFENSYYFPLYSLMDLGINYYGWSKEEFKDFLAKVDLFAEESYDEITDSLYDFFIDMAGTYCSYGIGYVNLSNLKLLTMNELGDKFDELEFHDEILKYGELPFVMVKQNVLDYIEKTK